VSLLIVNYGREIRIGADIRKKMKNRKDNRVWNEKDTKES